MITTSAQELLDSLIHKQEQRTEYDDFAYQDEMYSYSNNKNKKKNKNTFQQSNQPPVLIANVETPSALPSLPSAAASQPGMNPKEEKVRIYGREAKKDDYFIDIRAQLSHPKVGKITRATMYFSMKTDTDQKYNIFLRSKLTSANNETMRSVLNHRNYSLRDKLQEFIDSGYDNLWTGRIQYKPTNGFITQQHRKAHKYGLCAVFTLDEQMYCVLYFNGEVYDFEMNDIVTPSQKQHYSKEGVYIVDEGECE
jgi:hypothetical protein